MIESPEKWAARMDAELLAKLEAEQDQTMKDREWGRYVWVALGEPSC